MDIGKTYFCFACGCVGCTMRNALLMSSCFLVGWCCWPRGLLIGVVRSLVCRLVLFARWLVGWLVVVVAGGGLVG